MPSVGPASALGAPHRLLTPAGGQQRGPQEVPHPPRTDSGSYHVIIMGFSANPLSEPQFANLYNGDDHFHLPG